VIKFVCEWPPRDQVEVSPLLVPGGTDAVLTLGFASEDECDRRACSTVSYLFMNQALEVGVRVGSDDGTELVRCRLGGSGQPLMAWKAGRGRFARLRGEG